MDAIGGVDAIGGLDAITIDCAEPPRLATFWSAVFGTRVKDADGGDPQYVDLEPVPGVPILRFQRVPEPKTVKNRLHLDVFVEDIEQACSRAEALGGQRLTERTISEYGYEWHVVADPEGNEFCFVTRPP